MRVDNGVAHFAGGVFHTNRYARVMRVQDQMFERAESRIALPRIGGFPRAAHVQNQARVRQIIGDIDHALQFVHCFDAPHTLDFADRKRCAALAHGAQVPARWPMQRYEFQVIASRAPAIAWTSAFAAYSKWLRVQKISTPWNLASEICPRSSGVNFRDTNK